MRFESIELLRYGHFSGQALRFPHREHDFHLIVGRNEAGKSTLRQAFHDLLFGMPMNTPMAFLHGGPELALNAVLADETGQLAMGRRRRRDGGLVDAAGEKLAPETFGRWLGGASEAFYERMFGLDHRRLEQGSRAMLQAGDDVDSVLFQAAAGLATLNQVQGALREEAASLWTPHHSRNRAWYAAADRYKAADKALKEATVRPTRWQEAQRESRRLDEAFDQARDQCAALRRRLMEIERLRRLAPVLAQMRDCETLLGDENAQNEGGAALLALEADILSLEEKRLQIAGHGAEIEQCRSQIQLLHEQLAGVLRQLGRDIAAADTAGLDAGAAQLPPQPLRHEIKQLLETGRALRTRLDASRRSRAERLAEIEDLRARIQGLPTVSLGHGLRRALDAALAAGDLPAMLAALRRRLGQEEAELARRLESLHQPGVEGPLDIPALAGMKPYASEALVEHAQRRRDLRAGLDAAAKQLRDAEQDLNAARLKSEQFRRSHQAVSQDEVLAARAERDVLWKSIADGKQALAEQAERYASLVLMADVLVDRQLAAVDDAARLQALDHECERLQAALYSLQQNHQSAADALAAHEDSWRAACAGRQLPELAPADMQGWQPGREAALQVHERLALTRSELGALEERQDVLLQGLLTALEAEGETQENDFAADRVTLSQACDAARALLQQADGAAARQAALAEQLQRLEPLLPVLEQDYQRDASAHEQWLQRRSTALQRAGWPEDADDAYAEAALDLLTDADALFASLREQQARLARLNSDSRHFTAAVEALAERLVQADFQPGMAAEHLRRWVAQLAPLRAAARDREQARLQLASLQTRLLEEADGRDRSQIEAELAAADLAMLAAEVETLSRTLDEAEHERDALAVAREQARSALQAISGGDDAAQAEAMRQAALADMAEVAEQYAQVYTQYRLLEHITERYRERSQGPLLERAGRLFSELTLGAHESLVVDGDAATLWARRAGGRLTPLEGLSEGTRDQLYLALRLAALELYLDSAPALPFIADDLFVNYDDARSLAGLRQLAEISRRTQVIFLTHHEHMAELARDGLAGKAHIIELSGSGQT